MLQIISGQDSMFIEPLLQTEGTGGRITDRTHFERSKITFPGGRISLNFTTAGNRTLQQKRGSTGTQFQL